MKNLTIQNEDSEKRLDIFLSSYLTDHTRSQIKKFIEKSYITVNSNKVKSGYILKTDDLVAINEELFDQVKSDFSEIVANTDISLDIIYEDDAVLVINKQAGLVVHPGSGNYDNTLVNALIAREDFKKAFSNTNRPGIVHRLDKETSGLLVVAKTEKAHQHLAKQFETRQAHRVYYAITWHKYEEKQGIIESYIGRHKQNPTMQANFSNEKDGKYASSKYKVELEFPFLNLVRFKLETGRTHQIRVHSKMINHCIFADNVYSGDSRQIKSIHVHYQKFAHQLLKHIDRQALHAYRLEFIHPETSKKVAFESELPSDMKTVIAKLKNKFPEFSDYSKDD